MCMMVVLSQTTDCQSLRRLSSADVESLTAATRGCLALTTVSDGCSCYIKCFLSVCHTSPIQT